ncbi:MAG: SRPBCC family protein [Myxococcota bacterium]|nr:SRPBCC family protein [Myxococcota bacterium]
MFNADLATVHKVLLDTESYPQYIKAIQSSKVVYKQQNESEVSFKAKIAVFSFEYSIKTVKVSEHQITFEQKKGFFSFLNGEWRLKERNGVVEGKYIVNVKLPLFVAGKIVEKAIKLYFPAMLDDFKNEIERQFQEG